MSFMETIIALCALMFFTGGALATISAALVMILRAAYNRVSYLEGEEAKRQNEKV